jgi:uncharacterized membrane protein
VERLIDFPRFNMLEQFKVIFEAAAGLIEIFAATVIVFGFLRARVTYVMVLRAEAREGAFLTFRVQLGIGLLLGLEILVVADVIDTIVGDQSLRSLGVLAFLVVIRTILSWSTTLQAEGRWPWQPEVEERKSDG